MKFSKIYNYLFVSLPTKKLYMSFCVFFFFFNSGAVYLITSYYRAEGLTSRSRTGTICQINVGFRLEIKCTLFTIAGTCKQPRCSWTDEWIRKLWYIYTMEYYSAIKRNALESVQMRWMNLEPIKPSEISQKEKEKYCILTHRYGI